MKTCYSLALVCTLLILSSDRVHAQWTFAQFDGIPGESTNDFHQGWVDVLSYSHSLFNPIVIGQPAGTPIHDAIYLTKELDESSLYLIDALNTGRRIRLAVIEDEEIVGGSELLTYRVDLAGVYVNSYFISTAGVGPMIEGVSILYELIKITFWPVDSQGNRGNPVIIEYDVLGNTLAAEVVSLNVRADGSDVIFEWQTLSESGNYGFEIQHREQGAFKRAAYIPAAGWSSQPLEYQVRVRGLDDGIHVFRLASLELGGGVSYSQEITVALGVPEGINLALDPPYPNPFTERTNLAVSVARDDEARISIWDLLGREVAVVYEGPLQSGVKSRFVFDPETSLPAGNYLVRVKTERDLSTRMVTVVR